LSFTRIFIAKVHFSLKPIPQISQNSVKFIVMKLLKSLAIATIALTGSTPAIMAQPILRPPVIRPRPSAFTCGPHLLTFIVKSLPPVRQGNGVRCVKPNNFQSPIVAWYGEGNWEGGTYRHVGHAVFSSRSTAQGFASDIHGNGEDANNNFDGNLKLELLAGTWNNPTKINVTGAWNETWERVTSLRYNPLPRPKVCGEYFDQYTNVSDLGGTRSGDGLRCVLKVGLPDTTWFGNGNWGGSTYSHLGSKSHNGYGASDLCAAPFGPICNNFGYGSLRLSRISPDEVHVRGAWNEKWTR
jgi:hypothetical protein